MEHVIKPRNLLQYISCLSGVFITKDSPHGLTPTELIMLCHIYSLSQGKELTKEVRTAIANETNHGLQVITNYINKFKKKKVVVDNKLHPIFFKTKITIEYVS